MQEKDLFDIYNDELTVVEKEQTENDSEQKEYERYIEAEANICYIESMKGLNDFKLSEFISRSNGKGRKPRKHPREITIIKYRDTAYYSQNGGDIKTRPKGAIGLDVLAMEALENTGIEPTVDNLVETIRYCEEMRQRVRMYNKP